jgi:hypothetical protein
MAKPPATTRAPQPPAPSGDFERKFERALKGNKNSARSRVTAELRKMVEQDPESFARGIKGLINRDD